MYDESIVYHTLCLIRSSIEEVIRRSEDIHCSDDFLISPSGTILLDSICMKLTAMGECIKNLDKITDKELLAKYPEIPWRNVMGLRDIIVHHYFDVDADEIFRICKSDSPILLATINKMINDIFRE